MAHRIALDEADHECKHGFNYCSCVQFYYHISSILGEILSTKPTERDLDDISKEIGKRWRSFLIRLNVPYLQIEMEYEKFKDPVQTILSCLVGWREGKWKECEPVTWKSLLVALEDGAEQKGHAESLRRKLTERATSKYDVIPCSI